MFFFSVAGAIQIRDDDDDNDDDDDAFMIAGDRKGICHWLVFYEAIQN